MIASEMDADEMEDLIIFWVRDENNVRSPLRYCIIERRLF